MQDAGSLMEPSRLSPTCPRSVELRPLGIDLDPSSLTFHAEAPLLTHRCDCDTESVEKQGHRAVCTTLKQSIQAEQSRSLLPGTLHSHCLTAAVAQVIAGVLEERGIEVLFAGNPRAQNLLSFVARTGNTFLGSLMWVDYVRLLGLQGGAKH